MTGMALMPRMVLFHLSAASPSFILAPPDIRRILASYERNANGIDPIAEEFMRDLDDIDAMTRWAEAEGATAMTLEVNW
jgi:hypothetical protein